MAIIICFHASMDPTTTWTEKLCLQLLTNIGAQVKMIMRQRAHQQRTILLNRRTARSEKDSEENQSVSSDVCVADKVVWHVGLKLRLRYVVHGYGYRKSEDTAETPPLNHTVSST